MKLLLKNTNRDTQYILPLWTPSVAARVIQGYIPTSGTYKVIFFCPEDHTYLSNELKKKTGMEGLLTTD